MRVGAVAAAVACALALAPRAARADEPRVRLQLEAGSEVDTNPHRVSADANETYDPLPAAVARAGVRFALAWKPTDGRVVQVSAIAAAKKFIGDDASAEDVAVLTGDVRYEARLGDKPLLWGARLSYYDALEHDDGPGGSADHDFRTADAALSLTFAGEHAQRATLALGYRSFDYKPDPRYDFAGEHVQLEWRRSFEPDDDDDAAPEDAGSWDVAAWYGLARRAYPTKAYAMVCDPETEDRCLVATETDRVDLAHDAGAELTYTGERIYTARYQAVAALSNSFGQSLLRQRLSLSATSETWWSVFVTATVTVQVNQFVDSLLLERNTGELTIEDENRNSFTLHATRELGTGAHWAIEARYGFYSNEFATQTLRFRRQTAYLGLVFRL